MPKIIYQLSKKFPKDNLYNVEEYKNLLLEKGISEKDFTEYADNVHVIITVYDHSLRKIQSLRSQIAQRGISLRSLTIKHLHEKQWVNVWKDSFKSFRLTKKLKIVPIWEKKKYKSSSEGIIFIDTKLAFGTGLHETTRFTANLIERCKGKFQSFFDIGTGTGILAMVALKNGAASVEGIDIDAQAISIAKENLKNNGYSGGSFRSLDIQDMRAQKKFDFVAANLITDDLIRLKRKIVSFVKKDGFLAVSGVSLENAQRLKEAFKTLPLKCLKIEKGKSWIALLYKLRS